MPSGLLPTYSYVPPQRPGTPAQLRTCSSRRSRLFAGGTYFRSRELGLEQNRISVQVIEFEAPTSLTTGDGVCVITNNNLKFDENLVGGASIVMLSHQLKATEYVEFYDLHTPTPRARKYSISLKIAPDAPVVTELGSFSFSKLFYVPSLLSIKLTPTQPVYASTDTIVIKPRYTVHRLEQKSDTPTDPPGSPTTFGWDPTKLRIRVNADCPWVEMLERSGPTDDGMGGPPISNPNPFDVQDTGNDTIFLTAFAEALMSGGDGLPETPNNEITGPSRSIVHVNYGEAYNGSLSEVNIVYEWAGDTATSGIWTPY